jgi:trigger factor
LRAPIYEEKVVDQLLAAVKIEDRKVTVKELLADDDEQVPAA